MSEISCANLASALLSEHSHRRELGLGGNELQDSGGKLHELVQSPRSRLESVRSVKDLRQALLSTVCPANQRYAQEIKNNKNSLHIRSMIYRVLLILAGSMGGGSGQMNKQNVEYY